MTEEQNQQTGSVKPKTKIGRGIVIGILIVVGALVWGSTYSNNTSITSTPTGDSGQGDATSQVKPAASVKQPAKTVNGKGQQASEKFPLQEGLATFKLKHSGKSNFAVTLMGDDGRYVELLANEIGDFDGSKAVRIDDSGDYILDITADGSWTVSVE